MKFAMRGATSESDQIQIRFHDFPLETENSN